MKYQKKINNKTKCLICPRECTLSEGQEGFCHIRKNVGGDIILTAYGKNTGLSVDPIEKKPLYHFYPNSKILSFGTYGCNMGCLFCQNFHITKTKQTPDSLPFISPQTIVDLSIKNNIKSIAFTYNDPVVFFEYALDTAKIAKEEGIKTVAVSAGYMQQTPRKEFYKYIDGANIDLKGFSDEFYKKNCLSRLTPVLDTIKYIKNETDTHLEITTMLIEGENDSDDILKAELDWILDNIGDLVPLHFSAFTPRYKFIKKSATKPETLYMARELALSFGLKYVYTGNIINKETSTTYCKHCKKPVIVRDGYRVLECNLDKNGACIYCNGMCDGRY